MVDYNTSTVTYDQAGYDYTGDVYSEIPNLPLVGVFIGFDDTPDVADVNWVEVTDYVREVSISRGRTDDYAQFETGTASVVLDNRTRLFDPFNTAGTYYGKLVPRRQIKIVGQIGNTNYTMFRGYVAGWPVKWTDHGFDSTVTVECFDIFGLIATTELPVDWAQVVISRLGPERWFRMDEPDAATQLQDRMGGRPISYFQVIEPARVSQLAPAVTGGWKMNGRQVVQTAAYPATSITFCYWARNLNYFSSTGAYGILYMKDLLLNSYMQYNSTTPANSRPIINITHSTLGGTTALLPPELYTDRPYHIAIVSDLSTGTQSVYVDGVKLSTAFTPDTPPPFTWTTDQLILSQGEFQDAVVFTRALSESEIAEIYGTSAYGIEETTGARARRLIDLTILPDELVSITDSPVATVLELPTDGFVLPALQQTADSEGGEVFVDRNGMLQFVNRWFAFGAPTSATVQATFGENDIGYSDQFEIYYDADSIRNEVTVKYSGGANYTTSDTASVVAHGKNASTFNTSLATKQQATDLGELELTLSKDLEPTVGSIQVGNTRDNTDWGAILGLDLLHRIEVHRTPATGSAITQTMLVNRIAYRILRDRWSVSIEGSARYTGWFTADYSLTDGTDVVL